MITMTTEMNTLTIPTTQKRRRTIMIMPTSGLSMKKLRKKASCKKYVELHFNANTVQTSYIDQELIKEMKLIWQVLLALFPSHPGYWLHLMFPFSNIFQHFPTLRNSIDTTVRKGVDRISDQYQSTSCEKINKSKTTSQLTVTHVTVTVIFSIHIGFSCVTT